MLGAALYHPFPFGVRRWCRASFSFLLPELPFVLNISIAALFTIYWASSSAPVSQVLACRGHVVTKLSVRWSIFIIYSSVNTVLKNSDRKVCNLFHSYSYRRGSEEKTEGKSPCKKKHSTVDSQSKDLTPSIGKLLCLLTFSILPD